ncbi:hypothetical protein [Nocardia beijingensis]
MNISGHDEYEQTGNTMLEVRQVLRMIDRWFDITLDDYLRVFGDELRNPRLLFEKLVQRGIWRRRAGSFGSGIRRRDRITTRTPRPTDLR